MSLRITTIAASLLVLGAGGSAHAQSAMIDLSKPMTGKSNYVFNVDGAPVELGVHKVAKPETAPAPSAGASPPIVMPVSPTPAAASQEAPAASSSSSSSSSQSSGRSRTLVIGGGSRAGAPGKAATKAAAKKSSSGGRIRGRR